MADTEFILVYLMPGIYWFETAYQERNQQKGVVLRLLSHEEEWHETDE